MNKDNTDTTSAENYTRSLAFECQEVSFDSEKRAFSGLGVVFNQNSLPLRLFGETVVERIHPDAFKKTNFSRAISAYNHNFEKILGRADEDTVKFEITPDGVRYYIPDLPNTTYANDLIENVKRRNVKGSSFVFRPADRPDAYKISRDANGTIIATAMDIEEVFEMGPVVNPAYPQTTAGARAFERSLDVFKQEEQAAQAPPPKKASIRRPYWRQINNSNK